MSDTTIIYYTHNRERPEFERKIQANILDKCGDLPIISVSHQSIDFGLNICVGKQPLGYSNVLRQTLIGLKAATTKFCLAAEDDCLYPPEYFRFTPPLEDHVYRYSNIVVRFDKRDRFWKKHFVEAAQMCGREFWIKRIEKILRGHDSWKPFKVNPPFVFTSKDQCFWTGDSPVIYFKTRHSFSFKTGVKSGGSVTAIPYWGTAMDVYNRYLT